MKKILAALATMAALLTASLVVATPAQSAPSTLVPIAADFEWGRVSAAAFKAGPAPCNSGNFCLFNNSTDPFQHAASYAGTYPRNTCDWLAEEGGSISYVSNKTTTRWFLFRDSRCAGAHIEIPPLREGQVWIWGDASWQDAVIGVMRTSYTS